MNTGRTHFKSGQIPWNKGTKGVMKAWNKDKKGIHLSVKSEFKKGMEYLGFGFEKGFTPWNKGKRHLAGEKNPNWQGGITKLSSKIRSCFEYRQWRSDVFSRDDFTCQLCDMRGGELNVDHFPISFAEIFHTNQIDSIEKALECEEFWNINNGRTLCVDCHKKTDNYLNNKKTYGI